MSVANILAANGKISETLYDTSVMPFSGKMNNPATSALNMANFGINNGGTIQTTSLTHPSGGLNAIFIDAPLELLDTRAINFTTTTTNGTITADGSVEIQVNTSTAGGELLVGGTAAGGLVGAAGKIAIGDATSRTDGAGAGTFTLQKNTAGAVAVQRYLPINVGGVNYWIPLCASDPETT